MPSNWLPSAGGSVRHVLVLAVTLCILTAGSVAPVVAQDDQFDPNDDLDEATELERGTYTGLEVGGDDVDVFAAALEEGQELTVRVSFRHARGDVDVVIVDGTDVDSVYDLESDDFVGISESSTDDEEIRFTAPEEGTYYVIVYGYRGASNTYDMTLESDAAIQPGSLLGGDALVLLLGAGALVVGGYFVFFRE